MSIKENCCLRLKMIHTLTLKLDLLFLRQGFFITAGFIG